MGATQGGKIVTDLNPRPICRRFASQDLKAVAFASLCCLLLCACAPAEKAVEADPIGPGGNDLLALILKTQFKESGYTIVHPETQLGMGLEEDPAEVAKSKRYVREGLALKDYDPTKLVDALYAANTPPVRLTLPSSRDDGYLVDTDGTFEKYFETDGGGWEKLRSDNPLAAGTTSVSLPVIDKRAGIVLIYIGTQYDWTAGAGHVLAFRLENGQLQKIGEVMMWIS